MDKWNINKLERVVNFMCSHELNEPKTKFAERTDDLIEILNQVKKLNIDDVSNCTHPFKEVAGAFCNKCKKYL